MIVLTMNQERYTNGQGQSGMSHKDLPMTRRGFLADMAKLTTVAAGGFGAVSIAAAQAEAKRASPRKLRHLGWQVGVTYQAPAARGLARDDLMRLLDEMAGSGMNLLSLMMISYAFFDPQHDGYAWPVKNPKLKCYWDRDSINGRADSEFVSQVIEAAAKCGVEVQLMMNWGIWNPERICQGYPSAVLQQVRPELRSKAKHHWVHCPDSPGAWQAGLDEVEDLLRYYDDVNVKSYSFERLGYLGGDDFCFCPNTIKAYEHDTGKSMLEADKRTLEVWRKKHVGRLLSRYVEHVRRIRPGLKVALHTQCSPGWGHNPQQLPECGFDYLMPHTYQFPETRESFHLMLDRLAPNRCVLHFCSRDCRPANYALWIKTPEIIAQGIDWILDYPGRERIEGIVFFNPTATSPRNRKAVYEQIKRFTT